MLPLNAKSPGIPWDKAPNFRRHPFPGIEIRFG